MRWDVLPRHDPNIPPLYRTLHSIPEKETAYQLSVSRFEVPRQLTVWSRQCSGICGRCLFVTICSCIASRVGWRPSSDSNGSEYSGTWPLWAEHRDTNSHNTKAHAYTSMRRKASRVKLIAPSSTSGAMYRRVPTCPCVSPHGTSVTKKSLINIQPTNGE